MPCCCLADFHQGAEAVVSATITGVLDKIVYANEENAYLVARIKEKGNREPTTIIGNIAAMPGESLRLFGEWVENKKFGRQFRVDRYESVAPASVHAIEKYLGSGLIKGVGKVFAARITAKFGSATLDVIEHHPERLHEVEGIGEVRVDKIRCAWVEQKAIKRVVMFLQEHGVSPAYAVKIFKTYGDKAIDIVSKNPYRLAADVYGIGFKTADTIAGRMGIVKDSPMRAEEGAAFALSELADSGHVYYPVVELVKSAAGMLEIDETMVRVGIDALAAKGRVVIDGEDVYLTPFHHAETGVASRLSSLAAAKDKASAVDAEAAVIWPADGDSAVRWVEERNHIMLATNQKQAVIASLTSKVMVITGNPGCGKSTIVRCIVDIAGRRGFRVLLAAPTGRAAKRLSELSGKEAKTIHRTLEFKNMRFLRDQDNPLDADLIVVDEASMIDIILMYSLVKAVPPGASLILVGDVDQLPSVGPGNVLRDIIESGSVPVSTLNEIFRQAQDSMIVVNAHRINRGEKPLINNAVSRDFFFIDAEEPEKVVDEVVSLVTKRLPAHFRVNAVRDIQVLCPMHRGIVGVGSLNSRLQEVLNPPARPPARPNGAQVSRGGRIYRVGDKVMQMVNNYDKDVFNGDIGIIRSFDFEEAAARIDFDGTIVEYEFSELDDLALAYACSVHKAQGSEYPVVVIPIHTQHYVMLQRNLVYTALTRARKAAVFVGTRKAMAIALRNDKVRKRYSRLGERLQVEAKRLAAGGKWLAGGKVRAGA
ncbi:MAG: ATP-dependent RecD-like DNA helicase [Nitrospirae bacterium]|nr:ATP-dependent RecD-like DNA helicase [Nitrospirota bacterium]